MGELRPGVYVTITNASPRERAAVQLGTVAALFRSGWGPVAVAKQLASIEELEALYGTGDRVIVGQEAFLGGAEKALAFRLGGAGAVKAFRNLQDTTGGAPVDVVKIEALYEGIRGNGFSLTIRDSLTDATKRQLLVYEGTTLLETIEFAKGAAGEVDALVAAVAASGSVWITASKLAPGNGTMAAIATQAMAGGVDPTIVAQSYTDALAAIEAEDWNVLATDNEDGAIATSIAAYIARVRTDGKKVMAVVAEPSSVAWATRCANAAAFNSEAVVYVANGFTKADGVSYEGYKVAGRIAGMIAGTPVTLSLTHAVIPTATGLVDGLTVDEIKQAIQSGALVFSLSRMKQVQVEYAITTLVNPPDNLDDGWKKIKRVRTRDNLVERIEAAWDPLIGKVSNSPDGRATLRAMGQGVINEMITEKALLSGNVIEDPAHPAAGDSAHFLVSAIDPDNAEKLYAAAGFQF